VNELAAIAVTRERMGARTSLIAVSGQVDLYTAPELKEATVEAIEEGATHLVIDLTDTSFMDSTGLGVLVGAIRRLRPLEGSLAIIRDDDGIRRLFELSGLTPMFEFYESRSQLPPAS
jgi:anti-sigma B factor antagonist